MRGQLLNLIRLLPRAATTVYWSGTVGNTTSLVVKVATGGAVRGLGTHQVACIPQGMAYLRRWPAGSAHPLTRWKRLLSLHASRSIQRTGSGQAPGKSWTLVEQKLAALLNGLSFSPSGQGVFLACFPVAAVVMMFPRRFKTYTTRLEPQAAASIASFQQQRTWSSLWRMVYSEVQMLYRAMYLSLVFFPVVLFGCVSLAFGIGEHQFNVLLRWCIERAGPAFIKWGQWASTRADLFPQATCDSLEHLQSNSPSHKGSDSVAAVERAFGLPLNSLFDEFDVVPIASGSIAQVHRARLSEKGAELTGRQRGDVVAVKVRHPSVSTVMETDFALMMRAANLLSQIPGMDRLRLDESVRQFGAPLREQLDLSVEAQHLTRFQHNFRSWHNVSFPSPLYPLVHTDVLVESFEEGKLISHYVNAPARSWLQGELALTGLNLYLQMLLKDNFIHADLHPGNILVTSQSVWKPRLVWNLPFVQFLCEEPKLVLLDTGMTAQLTEGDQKNLLKFFSALTKHDGENIAKTILLLSENDALTDKSAFVEDMASMFEKLDAETIRQYTADVLRDMIETIRKHQVTLKSCVSCVVMTTLVLEGWSTKLNPDLRILDSMREMLATDWVERISRTVDRTILSGSLA